MLQFWSANLIKNYTSQRNLNKKSISVFFPVTKLTTLLLTSGNQLKIYKMEENKPKVENFP